MTRFLPFVARLLRHPWVLAALLGAGLSACDRQDANMFDQSGVWDIQRVTATSYDSVGTVTNVETVTDAGQVAFIPLESRAETDDLPASSNPEVRFYLDKPIPNGPIALLVGQGGSILEWYVEEHQNRRILIGAPNLSGTVYVAYTLTRNDADYQEWESVRGNANNVITRRETWQVRRTE